MVQLSFLILTERAFGSHPRRVVSVSYVRVTPFHGDILHTSRTQILPDLVPSKGKQEASSVMALLPDLSMRVEDKGPSAAGAVPDDGPKSGVIAVELS